MDSASNESALHWAVQVERKDIIEKLLASGCNVNVQLISGETPLHQAASQSRPDIVLLLLQNGADVTVRCSRGCTALACAAFARKDEKIECVDILLEYGADINSKSEETKFSILHEAVVADRSDVVDLLLSRGADATSKNRYGSTPLQDACRFGLFHIADLLISNVVNSKSQQNEISASQSTLSSRDPNNQFE